MSICNYCDRAFCNEISLQQHFKNSSAHEWCDRCQQAFNSVTAKQQHLTNSASHHRCTLCSSAEVPDFFSYRDLKAHLENFHHFCTACNQHLVSAGGLRSHDLAVHNMCSVCDSYFQTPDNLRAIGYPQHRLTHMPKVVECFGCDEKFVTSSAMVLHLESGYCRCQIDCDEIKQLAYKCYQASHYITGFDDKPFRCEYCNGEFSLMSALLQHVETDYCEGEATYDRPLGRFLNFLKLKI